MQKRISATILFAISILIFFSLLQFQRFYPNRVIQNEYFSSETKLHERNFEGNIMEDNITVRLQRYSVNDTLVFTICNRGMAQEWLQQWYVSARRAGISNIVVVATDEEAYSWISERIGDRTILAGDVVDLLMDERWNNLRGRNISHAFNWRSKGYEKVVIQRASILKGVLKFLGKNIIYSDTDLHWFKDPSPYLNQAYSSFDVCVQRELGDELGDYNCSGFMYIRFSELSLKFLTIWEIYIKNRLKTTGFFTDQEELNHLFTDISRHNNQAIRELDGLRATTLDWDEFPSGINYYKRRKRGKGKNSKVCVSKICSKLVWENINLSQSGFESMDKYVVHHNFAKSNQMKIKRAKKADLWLKLKDNDWFNLEMNDHNV